MKNKILVADDEAEIRVLLKLYLEKDGYEVLEASDGLEALSCLKQNAIDLAVLDVMMPKMDGLTVLREIRKEKNIPVLMLSAKNTEMDKILGLELGADDYIGKPFNPMEAVARIHSNIRRFYALGAGVKEANELKVRDLRLDIDSCLLFQLDEETQAEKPINLTSVEYRIMQLFMEHPGKVYTKQQIFDAGWEESYAVDDNSIMVCISKLRSKLSDDGNCYIATVRGLGYRFLP